MPLINRLPPLTLSFRRADVFAFWLLATSALVLVTSLAAVRLAAPAWAWGAAAAACLLAPALWWRGWLHGGIATWNRIVRVGVSALRTYVLAVSYYVFFAALGRAGSLLDISPRRPQASKWLPLASENAASGVGRTSLSPSAEGHQGLRSWASTSGHAWALCLLPITTLLLLLEDEQQDTAPPSSTYTLY